MAQNTGQRRSAIDGRTTRHTGYGISQEKRKRIEEVFGWLKTVAGFRWVRRRGVEKVAWMFTFAAATYNLVRAEAEVCENAEKRRTSARVTRTVSLRMAENHMRLTGRQS